MSFTSQVVSFEYDGNNSTSTPYTIPFPFLTVGSVKVSVTSLIPIGIVDEITPGAGFTDYLVTLEEGMDPDTDVPSVGDLMQDADGNEGIIISLTNHGDGTFTMSISDQNAFDPGDGTTVTHHDVDLLNSNEFTVTALADLSGGSFVTDVAVAVNKRVRVFRQTIMNQPLDLQPAGPFPAAEVEKALDRLTMIMLEQSDRIAHLEGSSNHSVVIPVGQSFFGMSSPFANTAARGAATPTYIGQLGIQLDTGVLYKGASIAPGQWTEFDKRAWDYYRVLAYNAAVGTLSDRPVGTVPDDGTLLRVIVAVTEPGTVSTEVSIVIGGTTLPTAVIPTGETAVEIEASGSFTGGQQITVNTTGDYGAPDATGLEIFLVYDRS
jgi:hypothetical protein